MKIIRRGKKPEEKKAQGTCHRCNSLVEVEASECKRHSDQREGDYYSFDCPVCKIRMSIPTEKFV